MKIRISHPAVGELAFPLEEETFIVIGRDDDSVGIELNWDPQISRRHARIWISEGAVWFEDLGSTNGSWLKGARVMGAMRLSADDTIVVGETKLRVPIEDRAQQIDRVTREIELPGMGRAHVRDPRRVEPRFLSPTQVELRFGDREEFAALWASDISKGGVFIKTDHELDFGVQIEVRLTTPHGLLELSGLVVHVVKGDHPGVGIQFDKLDAEARQAISHYVDGIAEELSTNPIDTASSDIEAADLECARELLVATGEGDLYRALDLVPAATTDAITERVAELSRIFEKKSSRVTPPQLARLDSAHAALKRIAKVLTDPERRLIYDFRSGHVRPDQRWEEARSGRGPTMEQLRKAWMTTAPGHVEQANAVMKEAVKHRGMRDFVGALRLAKQALELNPFDEEIRRVVDAWELSQ